MRVIVLILTVFASSLLSSCDSSSVSSPGEDPPEESNQSPTADFTFSPSEPEAGTAISFNADASDPDGEIVDYSWDFTGDGSGDASGSSVTHTFDEQGSFPVSLTVTDDRGGIDTTTQSVEVEARIILKEKLYLRLIPERVEPGELAVVAISINNTSSDVWSNVTVSTIIPEGLDSFLAAGTGGRCANLLNNCIGGATLYWELGDLEPGQHRTVIFPALVRESSDIDEGPIEIAFSANANWEEGGGLIEQAVLEVAQEGTQAPPEEWLSGSFENNPLSLEIELGRDRARPGQVVPVSLQVSNAGDSSIQGVTLRLPVPRQVDSFIASTVGGRCSNVRNNCYPGVMLHWSLDTLEPGEQRSFQVPFQIEEGNSQNIPACATVYGENGSGTFTCSGVQLE